MQNNGNGNFQNNGGNAGPNMNGNGPYGGGGMNGNFQNNGVNAGPNMNGNGPYGGTGMPGNGGSTQVDYHAPNPVWFFIKVMILLGFIGIFMALLFGYVAIKNDGKKVRDYFNDTNYYDRYYYNGEYGFLRQSLYLYKIEDNGNEVYGKYWEIVHAYEHYTAAKDYSESAKSGALDYAGEMADEEIKALEEMGENVKFEDNQERIDKMIGEFE